MIYYFSTTEEVENAVYQQPCGELYLYFGNEQAVLDALARGVLVSYEVRETYTFKHEYTLMGNKKNG